MGKSKAERERIAAITRAAQAMRKRQSDERLVAVEELMLSTIRYTKQSLAAELGINVDSLMRWARKVGMSDRLRAWLVTDADNRVEDIRWMMRGQVNEVEVAQRLGITVNALWSWCSRSGNSDLWDELTAYRAVTSDIWKAERPALLESLRAPRDGRTIGRSRQTLRGRNPRTQRKVA